MNKFVAAALIASASFAAVSAQAGLAYSEGADAVSSNAAVSTLSRAEVQAQVARQNGFQLAYEGQASATPVAAASTVSRAAVHAAAVQAAHESTYTISVGQ